MSKSLAPAKSDQAQQSADVQRAEDRLFEVLTRTANGHRTVHRLWAADQAAAEAKVEAQLDLDSEVLDSAPGGRGQGLNLT